jgi:CheY-like chemotaxis protein
MSKTILVLDDEMLIALDIQQQLQELGHDVLTASSVGEALGIVDRRQIDVAIVDWHVGKQISAPLIEQLRARHIPFVLCSGSALDELVSLFPSSPLVTKPFAADALVSALTQAVDGKHLN